MEEFMPSEHQRDLWWEFIALKDGPVLDGSGRRELWLGWCPICDEERSEEHHTARFNFKRGLMWCDREDENGKRIPCHTGKRCVSLTNLQLMMRDRHERR